ncbi:hypothetical protein [Photobacterium leiognathi]|uniref:hypothetical protein n=1 Tax=Photobacterium leiognathi TaxID=553611 RepID=UPI0029810EA1|nr:hypothetical protein [Photobacterium leiognathi]
MSYSNSQYQADTLEFAISNTVDTNSCQCPHCHSHNAVERVWEQVDSGCVNVYSKITCDCGYDSNEELTDASCDEYYRFMDIAKRYEQMSEDLLVATNISKALIALKYYIARFYGEISYFIDLKEDYTATINQLASHN